MDTESRRGGTRRITGVLFIVRTAAFGVAATVLSMTFGPGKPSRPADNHMNGARGGRPMGNTIVLALLRSGRGAGAIDFPARARGPGVRLLNVSAAGCY